MTQRPDEEEPTTTEVNDAGDTESDPAEGDPDEGTTGADWSSEGGAMTEGPATDPDLDAGAS